MFTPSPIGHPRDKDEGFTLLLDRLVNNIGDQTTLSEIMKKAQQRLGPYIKSRCGNYGNLMDLFIERNLNGKFKEEIIELLTYNRSWVIVSNAKGLKPFDILFNKFTKGDFTAQEFRDYANAFFAAGADLNTRDDVNGLTYIHHLLEINKNNDQNAEIENILSKKQAWNSTTNLAGDTPLKFLLNRYTNDKCTFAEFINTAFILVKYGADITSVDEKNQHTMMEFILLSKDAHKYANKIRELLKTRNNLFSEENTKGKLPLQFLLETQSDIKPEQLDQWLNLADALHLKNKEGETLLNTAVSSGNLDIAKHLVAKGLRVESKTSNSRTLLHDASKCKNLELWDWLLEKRLDINGIDNAGNTPLHVAVKQNNVEMVEWFIKNKAELELENEDAMTPLELAKSLKLQNITDLLIGADAVQRERYTKDAEDVQKLLSSIDEMSQYGMQLKTAGASKGKVAEKLASDLKKMVQTYFSKPRTQKEAEQFKEKFTDKLNSQNQKMGEYRTAWSTIIKNIAIAFTGIGALLLAGYAIYSNVKHGKPLAFFQKNKTTTEDKKEQIEKQFNNTKLSPD